jgi:cytochrome c oxidase subunit 4
MERDMEPAEAKGHIVPYRTLIGVWLILLLLTAVLVFVSKKYHEALSVAAMLTITPFKAGLVFYYFMHLKYEKPYLKGLVFITLALLTIFIAMIFLDISFR